MAGSGKKTTKKSKPKKTAEEKMQDAHIKLVRDAFFGAGFDYVPKAANKNFTFEGSTTDFDDVFHYENLVVLCEYTVSRNADISGHLKKKKIPYDKILDNIPGFIEFFRQNFPAFDAALSTKYSVHQLRLVIIYCSLNSVKQDYKEEVPRLKYYDYNVAHYFSIIGKTLKKSSRFELFDFLGLKSNDVGEGVIAPTEGLNVYAGSILPESHSNFGTGYKVVSFYVDPQALLRRAYVLRKYGWREGGSVYQRMISNTKIAAVRRYLRDEKRVFINNIIVTLPAETKLLDPDGDTINPSLLQNTQPGKIQIPDRFNTVGIIDGQHRVFSYHEGGAFDEEISILREQQNLLVTGIVFPKGMKSADRLKFEARLFLEINANQTNARSDLKQEIALVINPFAAESVAKRVVNYLNDNQGPLRDHFERFFFEKDKLKTTSVVSFAIKPLTNPHGKQSMFSVWNDPNKHLLLKEGDTGLLDAYVAFCAREIGYIFAAVKNVLPDHRWTADRKIAKNFLTTTNVNGVIGCMRRIVDAGKLYNFDEYKEKLKGIDEFKFESFKSSQYNRMGQKIFEKHFKDAGALPATSETP